MVCLVSQLERVSVMIGAETTTNPVLAFLLFVGVTEVSGCGLLARQTVVAVNTVNGHVSLIKHRIVVTCTTCITHVSQQQHM